MSNRITIRNVPTPTDTDSPSGSTGQVGRSHEIDVPAMLMLLVRRRRWIIGAVGLVGILATVIMLLTPNRYTSTALILPSGKTDNLQALKAMAGLAGSQGGSDAGSSMLFPVILRSNLVRDSLLAKTYEFSFKGDPMKLTLQEYLGIDDPDRSRQALSRITGIISDTRTGEITVAVETEYPELSKAMVSEYLNQLEQYNLYSRRSEAGERVRYLARELSQRELALRSAEDAVESYQSRNRNWAATSSPILLKDLVRLKRDAETKATTYAYLLQEYEIAKLDAQKDVPVVRILDRASLPTMKSGPRRAITILGLSAVAFVLAVLGVFVSDLIQQYGRQTDRDSRNELAGLVAESFPRTRRLYGTVRGCLDRQSISVDK